MNNKKKNTILSTCELIGNDSNTLIEYSERSNCGELSFTKNKNECFGYTNLVVQSLSLLPS